VEALFEGGSTEVDEEADLEMHEPNVRQELLAVDWREPLNRL